MTKKILTIGRVDRVDLLEFSLENIPAKIDTGAYTSALHCEDIQIVKEDGQQYLEFRIPHFEGSTEENGVFKTHQFRRKNIRSSNGTMEKRYIIATKITLFKRTIRTEFSLTDRSKMKFPILLGRKLLSGRFLVDVAQKDLSFSAKKSVS